jgi:hypothetical protein
VHGCCTDQSDLREWEASGANIASRIIEENIADKWEIVVWDWTKDTQKGVFPLDARAAYAAAAGHGRDLAGAINKYPTSSQHIHLIAHSAGAKLIEEATQKITNQDKRTIHLTFLDAYRQSSDDYGASAAKGHYRGYYVEHYVDKSGLPTTDDDLPSAYNFDITDWTPVSHQNPDEKKQQGHQWPRYWYDKSVAMPGFSKSGYGFPLSLEGGAQGLPQSVTGNCKLINKDSFCLMSNASLISQPLSPFAKSLNILPLSTSVPK